MMTYRFFFRLLAATWAVLSLSAADLSSFAGTWVVAEAEYDGNAVPQYDVSDIEVTITGDKYAFSKGDTKANGTFKVDFSRNPMRMSFTEVEGPNAGRELGGLAEFGAGGWKSSYRLDGGIADSLNSTAGSGILMIRYQRKPGTSAPVAASKPLRALLLLGGCCHDYANQKQILKKGLEARANVQVDVIHSTDSSTHPPLPIYGKPDYAQGYDVVIHDECAADINDAAVVTGVLQPHRDGTPGVNLHCAMHSYRTGNPNQPVTPGTPHGYWFEYLGLQSSGHGPQLPIAIQFLPRSGAITTGLTNWTTLNEELYNNVKVWDTAKPLAQGSQGAGDKPGQNNAVVAWTHEYGPKKARVFSTTIGHNNSTVEDSRYLDLVTRGLLWSCGKLGEDGKPVAGYGK